MCVDNFLTDSEQYLDCSIYDSIRMHITAVFNLCSEVLRAP